MHMCNTYSQVYLSQNFIEATQYFSKIDALNIVLYWIIPLYGKFNSIGRKSSQSRPHLTRDGLNILGHNCSELQKILLIRFLWKLIFLKDCNSFSLSLPGEDVILLGAEEQSNISKYHFTRLGERPSIILYRIWFLRFTKYFMIFYFKSLFRSTFWIFNHLKNGCFFRSKYIRSYFIIWCTDFILFLISQCLINGNIWLWYYVSHI